MKVSELGEFPLIDRVVTESTFNPSRLVAGVGDDAAVEQTTTGKYLVSTCDMLVEGVHFLRDAITPWQLGYKAVAVNLSDVAAMGGEPTGILISVGIPADTEVEFIEEMYRGIKSICREFRVNLLGGDTVSSPGGFVLNVTALGEVEPELLVRRSGAKPGDAVFVTGVLGDSAAGLQTILYSDLLLPEKIVGLVRKKHLTPVPRVREGRLLAESGLVTSMNDISDGLASEVNEIARASQVGAEIIASQVPISTETKQVAAVIGRDPLELAIYGGEDYELVFTCPSPKVAELEKTFYQVFGRGLYRVGTVVEPCQGVNLVTKNGCVIPLKPKGYRHFAK